jgi:hypothetical protein
VTVLTFAVGAVLGGVLAAIASVDSLLGLAAQQAVTVVVQVFTLPLFAAVTIVLYVDLRVRKEGFDLQLLAERMGLPPGADLPERALAAPSASADPGGW